MAKETKQDNMFHVYQGTQPKYTGTKAECDCIASKLIADAISQGTDVSDKEHAVSVVSA